MNAPTKSKINWTSLIVAIIGILSATNVLPEDVKQPLTDAALIAGPALIVIFRTWFTEK